MRTTKNYLTLMILGTAVMAGCAEEAPPRSVTEFVENPILLEATMVRCSQDRAATRYDAECVNARQAVSMISAKEEAAQRADREARSEDKRQALRKTQEAAAQARRQAAESERLRKEAEYLAQFGVAMPAESQETEQEPEMGNTPLAVLPEGDADEPLSSSQGDALPATDGGNAPVSDIELEEDLPSDLESIRDELQRRNEDGDN